MEAVNNREKATLIWLAVAFVASLSKREIRGSLWEVAKSFAHPKVVGSLLAFAGWTVGLVALARLAGLWGPDVRIDTVAWFTTVGVAFFFSFNKVAEGGFFGDTARRAVAVTAFVEGFANLEVFGLAVELALLPVLTLLAGMAAVSESKKEYAPVRRVVSGLLTVVGVGVLAYVLGRLATDFDAGHTLRALALPVWLTIGSLPFVYAFGLVAEYEQAFLRIHIFTGDPSHRRRAKSALVRAAHFRAAEVAGFTGHWIGDLAAAECEADARLVTRRWRETWRDEQRASGVSRPRAFMTPKAAVRG